MVLTLGGQRPSRESPGTAMGRSLAWVGCWAFGWRKPRGPGSMDLGLAPSSWQGQCGAGRWGSKKPLQAFQEGTPHDSAKISLPSILLPSHCEKSIRAAGGHKLKWLNIRG